MSSVVGMDSRSALKIELVAVDDALAEGEALVQFIFADEERSDRQFAELLGPIGESFKAERYETSSGYVATREGIRSALLVGLGKRAEFADEVLRRASAVAMRRARERGWRALRLLLPDDRRRSVRQAVEGALLGRYENRFYRRDEDGRNGVERLRIAVSRGGEDLEAEVERGRVIAEATNWARALADEPANLLPPREFARRAVEICAAVGLRVEVWLGEEIRARGWGGLWSVGKGSDEPPALIVVRYEPEEVSGELWAFVGKGMTFDAGGICLKPWQGMEEMKADMAGGAAVLGALCAIARLRLPRRIVGIIPAAENMPSGRALKPGDVIKTLAGYTIEVTDTDAEGRLILADAIAHARQLGAHRIIDLATLTGSIIVALGDVRAGLFSNDDDWAREIAEAAERAGEPVWRMPLDEDYKKRLESGIADFKNYGGRPDATVAALLLSRFADRTPWAHLDIAGTAWLDEDEPFASKGATGAGVRTLVELAAQSADS